MRVSELFPPAIVFYAEEKSFEAKLIAVKKQSRTEAEFLYFLTHKVNNIIHETGRIYMEIDSGGNLYANSVSPYSESFWENIEPKVKPLITALINKRYLTYSSCEGHDFTFRRYVGLAFADTNSRQYVADYIIGLKIPGISVKFIDSVSNQKIDLGYSDKVKYKSKYNAIEVDQKDGEIKSFNVQFHRNYENYCFLEIIVLDEIKFDLTFLKNPIKNIWLIYMKKFKWDDLTNKLTNGLSSEFFKKYKF